MLKVVLAAATLCVGLATAAQAVVVTTYTTQAEFLAARPVPSDATVTFGGSGPGPAITLDGAAASASAGLLTVRADPGQLFGDGAAVVSTEIEREAIILEFSRPLIALGLSAFISDVNFSSLTGSLRFDLNGGSTVFALAAPTVGFQGLLSDMAFSSVRISLDTVDPDASSVAFVGLTDILFAAVAPVTDVPAPGFAALLIPAMALAGTRARATRAGAAL